MIFTKKIDFIPRDKNKVSEQLRMISNQCESNSNVIYIEHYNLIIKMNVKIKCKIKYEENQTCIKVYPSSLNLIFALLYFMIFACFCIITQTINSLPFLLALEIILLADSYICYKKCTNKIINCFSSNENKVINKPKIQERILVFALLILNLIAIFIGYDLEYTPQNMNSYKGIFSIGVLPILTMTYAISVEKTNCFKQTFIIITCLLAIPTYYIVINYLYHLFVVYHNYHPLDKYMYYSVINLSPTLS